MCNVCDLKTVTFVDKGRRFVTTSDDKSLRVWEWCVHMTVHCVAPFLPAVGSWVIQATEQRQPLHMHDSLS